MIAAELQILLVGVVVDIALRFRGVGMKKFKVRAGPLQSTLLNSRVMLQSNS